MNKKDNIRILGPVFDSMIEGLKSLEQHTYDRIKKVYEQGFEDGYKRAQKERDADV